MGEINIPGVSDKYKTNDLVKSLMEIERIPLKREKDKLEGFKFEQENWRRVNQYMSTLRESARGLFSFTNPFTDKQAKSSDTAVLTAEASRDASFEKHTVEVQEVALADRFLSSPLDKNFTVPAGTYTFQVGEKKVSFNWKGGVVADFVDALNKRSNKIVKASLIGVSADKKALLIESLITGSKNKLEFNDDAYAFAQDANIIKKTKADGAAPPKLIQTVRDLQTVPGYESQKVVWKNETLEVPPQNAVYIPFKSQIAENTSNKISLTVELKDIDSPEQIEQPSSEGPTLAAPPSATLFDITVNSFLPGVEIPENIEQPNNEDKSNFYALYIRRTDGIEIPLAEIQDTEEKQHFDFLLSDFENSAGLVIKNSMQKHLTVSAIEVSDTKKGLDYGPVNPVSVAGDAKILYQGILMTRTTNKIDDVIPNITLNLQKPSDIPVEIDVTPNIEGAKESVIAFVGHYNRLMAELNILTQKKPEIVTEITYFSEKEVEGANKRLGTLQGEFTLTNSKSRLQQIASAPYPIEENKDFILLSKMGISTKAGSTSGFSAAQTRGYLEIDEKKLDSALATNMSEIKNLFGFDSNGDKVIDDGIGFQLDRTLQSYLQTGGILASKNKSLTDKVATSEKQIQKLETQLSKKEAELKSKYSQMEGALNSLESQSTSISNFSNQNSKQ